MSRIDDADFTQLPCPKVYPDSVYATFFRHPPLLEVLFRECTPATLIRLSRTSRVVRSAFTTWMRRAFDIRKHLSPYFSAEQVRQLRGLQGLCGAVISGSSALQFFDRSVYPESDLDIYVPVGHVRFFCHWLLSCGYSHYPNSSQPRLWPREHRIVLWAPFTTPPAYTMPPVDSVFDFRKDGLLIQVVSTRDTPIEAILNFHSTCVMNLITYDGAYSLYPRSTFEDRESLIMSRNPLRSSQSRDDARLKYMRRGWKMVYGSRELLESQDKTSLGFSGITRHIGDSYTWTIPFDSAQIDLPEFTLHKGKVISLVTANSWRLSVSGLVHPVDDSNRVAWVPAPDDVEESAAVAIYDARVCTCAGLQFSIMLSGAIDSSQLYDLFAEVNLYRGSEVEFHKGVMDLYRKLYDSETSASVEIGD